MVESAFSRSEKPRGRSLRERVLHFTLPPGESSLRRGEGEAVLIRRHLCAKNVDRRFSLPVA